MKDPEVKIFIASWTVLVVGGLFFAGIAFGAGIGASYIKREAIERGHAIHDPATGEWRWKEDGE